jgi:hypothetical protein
LRPIEHLEFARLGGDFGWIEIWAGKFENAGESEIVADNVGKEGSVRFIGVGFRDEIGNGDAGLFDAKASAGAEPVLGEAGRATKKEEEQNERKEFQHTGKRVERGRTSGVLWRQASLQVGNG